MIWLFCAALTLLVLALLLWPVLRGERDGDAADRSAYDRTVFRDQLAELERDLSRGLIGEKEAEAARNEISRRLIAAAEQGGGTQAAAVPLAIAMADGADRAGCGRAALSQGRKPGPARRAAAGPHRQGGRNRRFRCPDCQGGTASRRRIPETCRAGRFWRPPISGSNAGRMPPTPMQNIMRLTKPDAELLCQLCRDADLRGQWHGLGRGPQGGARCADARSQACPRRASSMASR